MRSPLAAVRERWAGPPRTPESTLFRAFFERGLRTEGAADEGSAQAVLVRALATVAAPMLMAGFWIALLTGRAGVWSSAATHYLFVVYSFASMGCVATLQWESLFPERIDFLILLPLPLRPRALFTAKIRASAAFLLLFLLAANLFGTLLVPALLGWRAPLGMVAHGTATTAAGVAGCLLVLALEALTICVVPERFFRRVATVVQTLLLAAFLTVFLSYGIVGPHLREMLTGAVSAGRWFPPVWFLALYESVQRTPAATPFARQLAVEGLVSVPVLALLTALAYPAAWARRRRSALEGVQGRRRPRTRLFTALLHRTVLRSPQDRAVFHFLGQTVGRLSRYHVNLAGYCSTGLALCVVMSVRVSTVAGHVRFSGWRHGEQAILPLLLFWLISGLRAVFLLPADLPARWIFRLAHLSAARAMAAAKIWVLLCAACVVATAAACLALCGWSAGDVAKQIAFGVILATVLCDGFFFFEGSIPFTRPRLPGRQSLPLTLAIYVIGLPVFTAVAVGLEARVAPHPWAIAAAVAAAAGLHVLAGFLRTSRFHPASEDAFLDEDEDDFIALRLTA